MHTEFQMIDNDHARELATLAWQVKSLGEAMRQPEISTESVEWLAMLVERLGDELTLIAGEHIKPLPAKLRAI